MTSSRHRPGWWLCRASSWTLLGGMMGLLVILSGCGGNELPVSRVKGKVFFRDQPLTFGSVMFQPPAGPPARGVIQPDGTFVLTTYRDGDGAIIGRHQVRIACFETQRPDYVPPTEPDADPPLGRLLIPQKYVMYETSGIEFEVKDENDPITFKLQ